MNDSRTIKQTNSYRNSQRPGRAVRGAAAVTAQYIHEMSSRHATARTLEVRPAPTLRVREADAMPELVHAIDPRSAERSERARWLALYVLCAGFLMIILDSAIVNVALPAIQDDLGFSQSNLAWVVNAYLIAFGGLLLLAGRLGDLIGRRRMFMAGLAIFTVASLLCGVAQTQEMLIGARFLQGIGGAMTSAVILGMIVTMFPEPGEQAKAIGVYSFIAAAGASIGLLAGGVLTEALNWHWIFFVNLPIGVATARARAAPGRKRRGDRARQGRRRARRRAGHGGADARGLHDPRGRRLRLDVRPHARLRRRVARPARRIRRAPGPHAQSARAAADLPLAQRLRRQRGADADGRRDVRHVLPRHPVPARGAGLRRARDRPRVPAGRGADRGAVARGLGAPHHALRRQSRR